MKLRILFLMLIGGCISSPTQTPVSDAGGDDARRDTQPDVTEDLTQNDASSDAVIPDLPPDVCDTAICGSEQHVINFMEGVPTQTIPFSNESIYLGTQVVTDGPAIGSFENWTVDAIAEVDNLVFRRFGTDARTRLYVRVLKLNPRSFSVSFAQYALPFGTPSADVQQDDTSFLLFTKAEETTSAFNGLFLRHAFNRLNRELTNHAENVSAQRIRSIDGIFTVVHENFVMDAVTQNTTFTINGTRTDSSSLFYSYELDDINVSNSSNGFVTCGIVAANTIACQRTADGVEVGLSFQVVNWDANRVKTSHEFVQIPAGQNGIALPPGENWFSGLQGNYGHSMCGLDFPVGATGCAIGIEDQGENEAAVRLTSSPTATIYLQNFSNVVD